MIGCNPNINFGMPSLQGRRLTVYDIVTKLYYEQTLKLALEDYDISLKDAKDALHYCMNLKCKSDRNRVQYCDGCILRTFEEGWKLKREEFIEIKKENNIIVASKDKTILFAGSFQELEDSEFGKVTWLIAEEINSKL